MKRVLVFINYYGKQSETFISDEIEFLSHQKNIDLEILHYGKEIKEKNVKGLNMPSSFSKRLKRNLLHFSISFLKSLKYKNGKNGSLAYLIDFFRKNKYDVIYCHFGTNGKLIAELKELGIISNKTKLVVRFHGLDMVFEKYPIGYYDLLNIEANYILAGSNYAINDLKKYNIKSELITKLSVGLMQSNIVDVNEHNKNLGVFKIISVGRLVNFKGHLEAIEIMKKLKERQLSFKYTIIGNGPLLVPLQEKISLYNLKGEVEIIQGLKHTETLEKIRNSHLYLYPGKVDANGRAETQGLANLEAMANGVITIASNVGGVPDYVIDQKTGFLCEPENIGQFVEKINWIMGNYNSEELLKIRKNAVKMVEENYCQEDLNQKLLKILA